jgi:hypothetical protein
MRESPSLVPGAPEDFYVVVNRYGRHGTAFAETDLERANYENTIADLISGQHSDLLCVIRFNPDNDRAENVSRAVAQEIFAGPVSLTHLQNLVRRQPRDV